MGTEGDARAASTGRGLRVQHTACFWAPRVCCAQEEELFCTARLLRTIGCGYLCEGWAGRTLPWGFQARGWHRAATWHWWEQCEGWMPNWGPGCGTRARCAPLMPQRDQTLKGELVGHRTGCQALPAALGGPSPAQLLGMGLPAAPQHRGERLPPSLGALEAPNACSRQPCLYQEKHEAF